MEAQSPLVIGAAAAIAGAAFIIVWSLTTSAGVYRDRALGNLRRETGLPVVGRKEGGNNAGLPARLARALTPAGAVRTVDRLLAGAGRPAFWPLERVLVAKLLLAVVLGGLGLVLISAEASTRNVIFAILLLAFGWVLPEILLYNSSTRRRAAIRKTLPDVLDQLTIAVEAGLGFEASLAHVGRQSLGPLGDELIRTLQDIQVGTPRRVAYRALAERAQVDDLTRFTRAIIQAEQYGVSIASVLEAQAREMRVKRRQRAEESALKIPVKVVFPLTVFILPTLFIIVLGPAVLNAIESFPKNAF